MKPCKLCGELPRIVRHNSGIACPYHVAHHHVEKDKGHYIMAYGKTEAEAIAEWDRLNEEGV
jgi:hypothetical protein